MRIGDKMFYLFFFQLKEKQIFKDKLKKKKTELVCLMLDDDRDIV